MPKTGQDHGKALKSARERLGLTQVAAAEKAGIIFQHLSALERGKPMTLDQVHRIATAIGADPAEIDPRLASTRRPLTLVPQFETDAPDCTAVVFIGELESDRFAGATPTPIVATRSGLERLVQDAMRMGLDLLVRSGQEPRRPAPPPAPVVKSSPEKVRTRGPKPK